MPYTAPTLTQAQAALADRLYDPTNTRWVASELTTYLAEALRVWSAYTLHWRDQASFTSVVGQAFYDLPTEIAALRGYTVTNWDLVADLQSALLEPIAPGGTWTGSDQFTLAQLSQAIWRRRDQFLRETGQVVTRQEIAFAGGGSGRISLDEAMLQVRRAAYRPTATQRMLPLLRTDEWAANAFRPSWPSNTAQPTAYSTSVTPPLTLQLISAGTVAAGTLDLVSVNQGAAIDPTVEAVLGIPDDWCWVLKYGALADLLQGDGLALDPGRAAYCEARWQQGIDVAKRTSVLLSARIDDVPCMVASLNDADSYSPTWQLVSGVPRRLVLAGLNLVALWPPPGGAGPYTVTLDVVQNAPIPSLGSDVLQINQDVYDAILDYSQHIALVKDGSGQTELSQALLQRFARAANVDLDLQQAQQPSRSPLLNQQRQDEHAVARELPQVEIG